MSGSYFELEIAEDLSSPSLSTSLPVVRKIPPPAMAARYAHSARGQVTSQPLPCVAAFPLHAKPCRGNAASSRSSNRAFLSFLFVFFGKASAGGVKEGAPPLGNFASRRHLN